MTFQKYIEEGPITPELREGVSSIVNFQRSGKIGSWKSLKHNVFRTTGDMHPEDLAVARRAWDEYRAAKK